MPEATGACIASPCAVRLSAIFDDGDGALARPPIDLIHRSKATVQMGDDDGACAIGERLLEMRRREGQRSIVDVRVAGARADRPDRHGRVHAGVRSGDHVVIG